MVRFLHTSDWQLGMTRRFLTEDAQARFTHARFDAITALGELALRERCAFMVVAGDVFESNQLGRETVSRALDALAQVPVPIYLLPGNHDPLNGIAIFRSSWFAAKKPDHVHVLESTNPVSAAPGVEVVGAPWASKRPGRDLVAAATEDLAPATGSLRVLVGHGAADALWPLSEDPARIRLEAVEAALAEDRVHYVALGDRHSATAVGTTGRVWYSGAPEPTAFDEENPGQALVVELTGTACAVTEHRVGRWRFVREVAAVNHEQDVRTLEQRLADMPDKRRSIVRLELTGTLALATRATLDRVVEENQDLFPALFVSDSRTELAVLPDQEDLDRLALSGYAQATLDRLRILAEDPAVERQPARDALALLYRLVESER